MQQYGVLDMFIVAWCVSLGRSRRSSSAKALTCARPCSSSGCTSKLNFVKLSPLVVR